MPNGADAPGNVLPSSLVPMNVLTVAARSPAACAATHGMSVPAATPVRKIVRSFNLMFMICIVVALSRGKKARPAWPGFDDS